jgi:lincosamide nucleotidyltransferase A/C/D/E
MAAFELQGKMDRAMMQDSDVLEILNLLEAHGIEVWLNGGWGVDALLGRQTRDHEDLDITVSAVDRGTLAAVMEAAGFTTHRVDNEFNWVVADPRGRMVDIHLVDFSQTITDAAGTRLYGSLGLPFEVGSLEGHGSIAGKRVRCETAECQVLGHTRYAPDVDDYRDVLALCRTFDIEMPAIFTELGFS